MSKRSIKTLTQSITPVRPLSPVPSRDVTEIVETRSPRSFLSFQYSCTEVSLRDGRTHVRSNKTQFADGKLTREAFEGELQGDAYRQMVATDGALSVVVPAVDASPKVGPRLMLDTDVTHPIPTIRPRKKAPRPST